MQALAREMNLSETTFVLTPTDAGRAAGAAYRMRIFTPARELPFAGHPSIGTAWLQADEGRIDVPRDGVAETRQEITVGVLPLSIEMAAGRPGVVTMTQADARIMRRLDEPERRELAGALGLDESDFGWSDPDGNEHDSLQVPPAVVSTGLPFLVAPMRRLDRLAALNSASGAAAAPLCRRIGADGLALVARGSTGAVRNADVHVRMLDDPVASGFAEDPATGSAAGTIGTYLGHLAGAIDETRVVVIEQGVEIGRPSRLVSEVRFDAHQMPVRVRVSGETVPVIEGWVTLP
jgi:trans-2,3-dihydro-3-hydroxyanthranilate isomerase